MVPVLENPEFRVFSSPVKHLIPTIGLRIESLHTGQSLAYSCDTEPCPQVIQLASGVDVLIHEAAGPGAGHSSAAQAGSAAREAEVGSLYLIHYRTGDFDPCILVEEARKAYPGKIFLAKDFMEIPF
jgi:ribonuclease Z